MKAFIDMHHGELYESLRILFQDRLGYEVYRPIGLDWYEKGYWMVHDSPETANQYLGMHLLDTDIPESFRAQGATAMNIGFVENSPGIYTIATPEYDVFHKAVTLDAFKEMKFDILVSSIPSHIPIFNKLVSEYQQSAKHIFQIGNNWKAPYPEVKNILTSSLYGVTSETNCVFYHQEFSTKIFSKVECISPQSVFNMMHYMQNPELFSEISKVVPAWKFYAYGAGNPNGPCSPHIVKVAEIFKNNGFLWHVKSQGDGYGYNIHHAFACGRPIITKVSDFKGMTASQLLVDGETCIDIENRSPKEIAEKMVVFSLDYNTISNNVYSKFREVVDFDSEFDSIKKFMENLI